MIEMHWTHDELMAMPDGEVEKILILMNAKSAAMEIMRQQHGG